MGSGNNKATAVLVNWARPGNMRQIMASLWDVPWIDEILVWNNSSVPLPPQGANVRVIQSDRNVLLWGRFLAAVLARNELIVTQDDDYVVNNWDLIHKAALAQPDRIVGAMFYEPPNYRKQQIKCGPGWDIMLGWGSAFRRSWVSPTFAPYIERWGKDDIFEREADRIFAVMRGRRHCDLEQAVTPLPGFDDDSVAMHRQPGDKWMTQAARWRAAQLLQEMGLR